MDARGLAMRLRKYDIHSKNVRIGDQVRKGYGREQFWDAWTRYLVADEEDTTNEASPINTEEVIKEEGQSRGLGPSPYESATSATPLQPPINGAAPRCRECGRGLIQPHSIQRSMCESCFVAAARP
jgi:Protein of unknown function (DUF3631)